MVRLNERASLSHRTPSTRLTANGSILARPTVTVTVDIALFLLLDLPQSPYPAIELRLKTIGGGELRDEHQHEQDTHDHDGPSYQTRCPGTLAHLAGPRASAMAAIVMAVPTRLLVKGWPFKSNGIMSPNSNKTSGAARRIPDRPRVRVPGGTLDASMKFDAIFEWVLSRRSDYNMQFFPTHQKQILLATPLRPAYLWGATFRWVGIRHDH